MKTITEAGGIVFPASPSFYSKPATIDELISTTTDRILILAGFTLENAPKWGNL